MSSNLYQAANGTYYARIQIRGRDIRRSLRTTDRRTARQRLKELLEKAEDQRAGIKPPEVRNWEDAVVRWEELQFADLRPSTQTRYRTSLRQLHPCFAGRNISLITSRDVHEFVAARRRTRTSGATIRRDLMVMGRIMRVARRAGWITANPVPDEMEEIKERREPIRPVALRDLARLTRRAPPGMRDMIRFLARTGCRQEEAASLSWEQLDLKAPCPTVTFARTKTRSPRVVRLSTRQARELQRSRPENASGYVFRNPSGQRYTNVPGRFRVLLASAIPDKARHFRCHDLRHTYAIRALQQGASIYDVSQQLGHSSVKTTEIYAAWLSRRIR